MPKVIYAPGTSGIGTRARAKAWIGRSFSPGWCLYWCLTQVFKVPGLGDYDHDGSADAEDYWKAAVKRGKVVKTNNPNKIPAGALIMWTGGSADHGHAAYSLGNGEMVSTDLPIRGKVGRCSVDLPRKQWGHKLVGYVLIDGNGFTLSRTVTETPDGPPPVVIPPPHGRPASYTVTAKGGLIGRKKPSTSSPKVWLAKEGGTVKSIGTVTAEGRDWAMTKNGTYYALEFLKLKE